MSLSPKGGSFINLVLGYLWCIPAPASKQLLYVDVIFVISLFPQIKEVGGAHNGIQPRPGIINEV